MHDQPATANDKLQSHIYLEYNAMQFAIDDGDANE